MKKNAYVILAVILLGAISMTACQPEANEDPSIAPEISSGGAGTNDDDDGDDGSSENGTPDSSVEPVVFPTSETCQGFPNYVPCGSFMIFHEAGNMNCPSLNIENRTLDKSPDELMELTPQDGGDQLFARAAGSAEGTLTLIEIGVEASQYSGLLTNSLGQDILYSFLFFADGLIESGSITVVVDNPAGTGGECRIVRNFTGLQQ